ncbi:MAG: hypothetical protein NVSMB62_20540 [Acidobacteriaceae bacterium]
MLLVTSAHAADNQQQNRDRLKAAAEVSSLDGKDVKPWHWLMETTAFDKDGKNETHGSIEMWFSDGAMRTTVKRGTEEVTALRTGDQLYLTNGDEKNLFAAMFLQMEALRPIIDPVFQPSVPVALFRTDAGSVKLDCFAPTLVKPNKDAGVTGQPFSYCLLRDKDQLVATYGPGGIDVIRSRLGVFQGHQVPMELEVLSGKTKVAEAKTIKLSTAGVDASLFQVTPEMTHFTGPVVVEPLKIGGPPPQYPMEAKARRVSGTVVFDAVIGKDGHVVSLNPVGQGNQSLVKVSKDALLRWIYRPFEINGLSFEVTTQLKVNFAIE